jgi:DNA-binding MarR family transcriptional regulator
MRDSSLSLVQFGLMAQIAAARDGALSELAQRTGLDQSTLSRNLQVLEAAGLSRSWPMRPTRDRGKAHGKGRSQA